MVRVGVAMVRVGVATVAVMAVVAMVAMVATRAAAAMVGSLATAEDPGSSYTFLGNSTRRLQALRSKYCKSTLTQIVHTAARPCRHTEQLAVAVAVAPVAEQAAGSARGWVEVARAARVARVAKKEAEAVKEVAVVKLAAAAAARAPQE